MNISSKVKLNNGVKCPGSRLGVFKAKDGQEVENAVLTALEHGYRTDTAAVYDNEKA